MRARFSGMNFGRSRARDEPEINLVAFIDVLLVVLIFLMLTTTYQRFHELQLQLPLANADVPPGRVREIVVSVASDGSYAVDSTRLAERDVEALTAALTAAAGDTADQMLVVSADAAAAHQSIVTVLDAARRSGLTRLAFATRGAAGVDPH